MSDLLQQLPTLAGVAIGALTSYFTAFANERTKWRREQLLRRTEKLSLTYAEYGRAVKEMYQRAMHLGQCCGLPAFGPKITVEQAKKELSDANHVRAVRWEDVLLLGSDESVAAARRWHESIWEMERIAAAEEPDQQAWTAAQRESNDARSDFYANARKDLGVSGNEVLGRR
ncbi:hypothetical protein [Actinoplanes sp. NPDC051851]|uniref:hypothetical protein n=1 Tax=Actinoplanes sp. NPDC051851 TaxID=3154753 RepID=UPI00342B6613